MRLQRRPAIIIGLVLLAVLGTIGVIWLSGDDPDTPGALPSPTPPATGPASPSPAPQPSPSAGGGTGAGVRFDFTDGLETARILGEAGGTLTVREESQVGGDLVLEPRDGGFAVRFPEPCTLPDEKQCPRVILDAGTNAALNPGLRPLRWGAAVLMTADETSKGANVVQKGYSQQGTQFKLQIDGTKAVPTCVVAGPSNGANVIHVARAQQGVADGAWHTVDCVRDGAVLRILVDGVPQGEAAIPADLAIANDAPLRIGGKGVATNNDQFHGALDDVYVEIG
jgi:hypothetical protein